MRTNGPVGTKVPGARSSIPPATEHRHSRPFKLAALTTLLIATILGGYFSMGRKQDTASGIVVIPKAPATSAPPVSANSASIAASEGSQPAQPFPFVKPSETAAEIDNWLGGWTNPKYGELKITKDPELGAGHYEVSRFDAASGTTVRTIGVANGHFIRLYGTSALAPEVTIEASDGTAGSTTPTCLILDKSTKYCRWSRLS